MSVIAEMTCPGCSFGSCNLHQEKKSVKDVQTGLEIEVRCVCKNCGGGSVECEN